MFDNIQIGDRIAFMGKHGHTTTRTVQGVMLNSVIVTHGNEQISIPKTTVKSWIPKGKVIR